jgi:hypothetical protein
MQQGMPFSSASRAPPPSSVSFSATSSAPETKAEDVPVADGGHCKLAKQELVEATPEAVEALIKELNRRLNQQRKTTARAEVGRLTGWTGWQGE